MSKQVVREATIGLAFAQIKLRLYLPEALRDKALAQLDAQSEELRATPHSSTWLEWLEGQRQALLTAPTTPPVG